MYYSEHRLSCYNKETPYYIVLKKSSLSVSNGSVLREVSLQRGPGSWLCSHLGSLGLLSHCSNTLRYGPSHMGEVESIPDPHPALRDGVRGKVVSKQCPVEQVI